MVLRERIPRGSSTILLDRRSGRAEAFSRMHPWVVRTAAELPDPIESASTRSFWISYSSDLTDALIKRASRHPVRLGTALFLHAIDARVIPALTPLFRRVAFGSDGGFLPAEELADVLQSDKRGNLLIGGFVNRATETITLWRGSLESLTVPFSAFATSGDGTAPDFDDFSITDGGQTVSLGSHESAVDAILYEHDPEYRRTITKRRRAEDRSFGAALRRLRAQKGMRREDFEPELCAKTVARIEQGKVTRIRKATLAALAERLSVDPNDIAGY